MDKLVVNGTCKHFKGNKYRVLGVGKHTETEKKFVIYRCMYGDYSIWIRPYDMFFDKKIVDGISVDRFTLATGYNKLVRDNIIDRIIKNGESPKYKILNKEEHLQACNQKLFEEIDEYLSADRKLDKKKELADIQEVLYATIDANGFDREKIEQIRLNKLKNRGGFQKRLFLESVGK